MKYEWRKKEKELYLPNEKPTLVEIKKFKYITIEGKGNPNDEEFGEKVEVLYSLSYAIKMISKTGFIPEGCFDYTVYPLEGIWDLTEKGRELKNLNKDELLYKIMIKQPNFVTLELFNNIMEKTMLKKPNKYLKEAKLEEIEDGFCLQILHLGSYDDEPRSFKKMEEFLNENNYKRSVLKHKEIYLSDPRKVSKEKFKTVLRIFIEK